MRVHAHPHFWFVLLTQTVGLLTESKGERSVCQQLIIYTLSTNITFGKTSEMCQNTLA